MRYYISITIRQISHYIAMAAPGRSHELESVKNLKFWIFYSKISKPITSVLQNSSTIVTFYYRIGGHRTPAFYSILRISARVHCSFLAFYHQKYCKIVSHGSLIKSGVLYSPIRYMVVNVRSLVNFLLQKIKDQILLSFIVQTLSWAT